MARSILVVDDDPDTLTLIGIMLERRGYQVMKAESGAEALDRLADTLPDLVLLDVMMPEMDGYEVCHAIKANPRTALLLVVMLSAKAHTVSQMEGLRAGAIDYITKPVSSSELFARIQAAFDRSFQDADRTGGEVAALA